MKKYSFCLLLLAFSVFAFGQDPASLLEEGRKLEQKMKDDEALEKYRQAMVMQPSNVKALLKCAELSCFIGSRQGSVEDKGYHYMLAKSYAEGAWQLDSASAETAYMMAAVNARVAEVEEKKELYALAMRYVKTYGDRSVAANANYGKAWNVLGRWQYDLVTMNGVKRAAMKMLYGGLPPGSIDSAIAFMEKCKTLEPYYCQNFYDLGKAYQFNKQYEKAIGVLEQLQKLPSRRQIDAEIKAAGAVLLQQLQ